MRSPGCADTECKMAWWFSAAIVDLATLLSFLFLFSTHGNSNRCNFAGRGPCACQAEARLEGGVLEVAVVARALQRLGGLRVGGL